MRAGQLRDTIIFQVPVKVETEYSSREAAYKDCFCARANVSHNSGSKVMDGSEIFTLYTVKFTIHHYHKVTPDMVILHKGQRYRILDINPRYSQQDIVITGEAINE